MLKIHRNIKPTDKVYTIKEFVTLLEKNAFSYVFKPGEAHYANKYFLYTAYITTDGRRVQYFCDSHPSVITSIVIPIEPEQ